MSASQKLLEGKINGIESMIKGVEANMDDWKTDMKIYMDDLKTDLKTDMDELKINMNKLLQEMVTKGERVIKETHDENKRNVNHDSIDSNLGSKTHHIPKIDMRKFDGKDPRTWILHMEQFSISIMCKTHKRYTLQLYI